MFRHPFSVYYEDTDAQGVVYYANYFRFIERARTEWLETFALDLVALQAEHNIGFVVHEVQAKFHRPARLRDALEATVAVERVSPARLVLRQTVEKNLQPFFTATVTLACIDVTAGIPLALPAALRAALAP